MNALLLVLFALCLLGAPLLPALAEWRRGEPVGYLPQVHPVSAADEPLIEQGIHGVRFRRLTGAPLRFGQSCQPLPRAGLAVLATERRLVAGDFRLEPGECLRSDLVVRGDLFIGRGAVLAGSIKVEGDATVESGARIAGALFANGSIRCGEAVWLAGPVVSRSRLELGESCVAGAPGHPTTLSALTIQLGLGCEVHGSVMAGCAAHAPQVTEAVGRST
ncbi:hypothetical protein [Pseudomonas sp. Pseusp97]|uniref:hypothetical protein n=1 Tax=Pseudomonas sp. Pseusp97 TaxID=3243065 RepID=UPI0039A58937